jgi:hypothetical protein
MCGKGFTGEDGPVVLHMYSHEGYDEVRSFTDGRHALRALEDMPDAED